MTESAENAFAQLDCPQCGAPVARVSTSEADATGSESIEFRCANGHRIVVELHETFIDDDVGLSEQ